MKIRSGKNQVAILLAPRESMAFAQQLIKAALASGGAVEADRQEPTEEKVEERGG